MAEKVNTTSSVKGSQVSDADLKKQTEAALKKIEDQGKEKVTLPALLKPMFGEHLFVSVNGVHLHIPIDGKAHEVPKAHAYQVQQLLANLK